MSFEKYDIFFSGELIEGADEAEARRKIGALFKLPPDKVGNLFSGKPVAVKRDVDMDTAVKYRVAFRDAGALVNIKPATKASSEKPEAPAAPPAEPEAESGSGMTLAPANTGSLEDCAPKVIPTPIPDISYMNLDEAGTLIDESEPPPPVEVDTSALSLAPENSSESDES